MQHSPVAFRLIVCLLLGSIAGLPTHAPVKPTHTPVKPTIPAYSTPTPHTGGTPPGSNCANFNTWQVVHSPDGSASASTSVLTGVSGTSPSDIWAVGSYTAPYAQTLIEHSNGSQWTTVQSPGAPGSQVDQLSGVAALSTTDAWAVGDYLSASGGGYQTLIEHWDGTTWSVVPSPNGATGDNFLNGVAAISSSDVWAVGAYYTSGQPDQTLVEHWDGTAWSVVPSPNTGGGNNWLSSVAATSTSDVWAVRYTVGYSGASGGLPQTLIEHWNGTIWNIVPSPNAAGSGANELNGVSVGSATNVWAVGQSYSTTGATAQTLIERWDGTAWSIVPSPNVSGANFSLLSGVAAVSDGWAWAVGLSSNTNPKKPFGK